MFVFYFVFMWSTCCFGAFARMLCLLGLLAGVPAITEARDVAVRQEDSLTRDTERIVIPQVKDISKQIKAGSSPRFELELLNDNDMYLMILQDQYYTNGLYINFRKTTDISKLKASETNRLLNVTVGHQMYNAYTAQIDSIQAIDRPIAAYFFISAGYTHFYRKDHHFSYQFEIGTLGKRAFGEVLQVQLHRLLNMYEASGWQFQLHNAWGINTHFKYLTTLRRWGAAGKVQFDLSLNPEASIGTHKTRFAAAPLMRLGKVNAFGQSAHFGARLQSNGDTPDTELYLFYRPELSFNYYDATLQGGMFVTDKGPATSQPYPWMFSNQFGAIVATQSLTFRIRYFFNTKESKQSLFRHQYGSLSLAYRF